MQLHLGFEGKPVTLLVSLETWLCHIHPKQQLCDMPKKRAVLRAGLGLSSHSSSGQSPGTGFAEAILPS